MEHIGDNIRKIRVLLEIKQTVMAKMLNLSVNSYGKIERNEVKLKPERLAQIAHILGVKSKQIVNFNAFLRKLKHDKEWND